MAGPGINDSIMEAVKQDPALARILGGPKEITTEISDAICAKQFVEIHGERIRYCHAFKKWLIFDGRRWAEDNCEQIYNLGMDVARHYYQLAQSTADIETARRLGQIGLKLTNNRSLYAFVEAARRLVPVTPEELDKDIYKLNAQNCTIDLRDGSTIRHNSGELITKIADAAYNPDAVCPVWLKFLDRIMVGNQELISYLQRLAGYSLTGDVSEHSLFILFGSGRNGKSVFLNTLLYVLGTYGQQVQPSILLEKHNDNQTNDIASLMGVRFAPTSEIAEGRFMAEHTVKSLTGGDQVSCRFLYGEFFTFKPQAKLFLGTNHKPNIKGVDIAIWERIHLIPFTEYISESERDKQLSERLKTEADGILAWAVQGCLEWQKIGLNPPGIVRQAVDDYRLEMDVLSSFIEGCSVVPNAKVQAGQLYEKYLTWCKTNGETALNQRNFGLRLKERGFNNVRGSGGRYFWEGIGLPD